jgi:uncharacterized RDD family membrane protein YckC
MNTNDYTINQTGGNLAIEEPKRQTAASVVCRQVFNPLQIPFPVLAPPVGACVIENIRAVEPTGHAIRQVRPWVRYLARMVDIWLFSVVVGFAIGIYAPSILNVPDIVLTIGILFAWVFQESILLANCGTTPGKWLFKIKVRDSRGKKLSFSDALNRSFSVLFKGLGAGIPFIGFFALLSSRSKLKRDGVTTWDEDGGYVVTHERIGTPRAIAIAVIIVGFLSLVASV